MTTPPPNGNVVRLAALGDLHCGRGCQGAFQRLFAQVSESADVLVLAGDLTDHGQPEEAQLLAQELRASLRVPVVGVLGNHDYEAGHVEEVQTILTEGGVRLLDGDAVELHGIGIAGVKGFAGGFGARALQSWGERVLKAFVREAVEEALKLESALARLRTAQRIVLLHYAPVRDTVDTEPAEILPFLGSSRLEEPINRYAATAVLHGHAHHGRPEGRTASGIPVYNVSLPVLRATLPDRPIRLLELPVPSEATAPVAAGG